ncbi:MAG: 50S ribosomal protein L32 [Candidatus Acetothermia bacterium]|jgi:large subunit ribosomal protein L32|nr:50S ribosomal protein L32 [Candidatus Acetothermia bacterium]MDH7505311.1 50S ribosomal protein L32 [Candidatus Acetothermia bacterium]
MGVPKDRKSKSRVRKRQMHLKAEPVAASECPHCHEPKLPHRVCPECGYYKGMEIVKPKEKEKKE